MSKVIYMHIPPWTDSTPPPTSPAMAEVEAKLDAVHADWRTARVEDWPSLDGFWRRTLTWPDGTCATYELLGDDGEPRRATVEELEQYYGVREPFRMVEEE